MAVSISAMADSSFLADSASRSWLDLIVAFLNRRARFLQRGFGIRDRCARGGQRPAWHSRRLSGGQPLLGAIERCGDFRQAPFRGAAKHALLPHAFFGRALRAVAAVERVIQREAVIALRHRVARALKGLDGAFVLDGRVAVGPRRSCGVDGALRLVHLAAWRLGARERERQRSNQCDGRPGPGATRHYFEYSREESVEQRGAGRGARDKT